MKLKQFFATTLLLAFATCLFATPASAANASSNPTAELISADTIVQDSESGIMPLSNTGFSFSLAAGRIQKSAETYYIYEGEGLLEISSLTWTPTGQSVSVGYFNVDTNMTYTVTYYGGTVSNNSITTNGVPDGEYYIMVKNLGTKSISGSINYSMS